MPIAIVHLIKHDYVIQSPQEAEDWPTFALRLEFRWCRSSIVGCQRTLVAIVYWLGADRAHNMQGHDEGS
jgi:hypothetical protein